MRDVAKRRYLLFKHEEAQETVSVSTMDFFGTTSDDMILFWGDDETIQFSTELKAWFADLKSRFEKIVEYADENYYRVYTFSDFFQETVENLNDNRFLALWRIYDEMLHDPELEDAGSVIFVPEGPEYEHIGLHYFGTPPRRRLKNNWEIMAREEKFNRARVTFRHYMALMANRRLRGKIFGF